MPDAELVNACERYLSRKGCTLWGRAFDVISRAGRREAAEWLAEQVAAVQAEGRVAHGEREDEVSDGGIEHVIGATFTDPFNPVPDGLREPTSEECKTNACVGPGFAAWYPQMGGYVGACVVVPEHGCFDAYVWHDGDFPFGSVDTWGDVRHPARIHHCDPEQFIKFGELVKRLLPQSEDET